MLIKINYTSMYKNNTSMRHNFLKIFYKTIYVELSYIPYERTCLS